MNTTAEAPAVTTSRKGWAPLSRFASAYKMPDGSWLPIKSFEDIDRWMAAWGDVPEPSVANTGGSAGQNTPTPRPGEAEAIEFIRNYTGNFGLILDLRSDRRFGSKWFRLSDRQIEVVLASKRRDAEFAARREQAAKAPVERKGVTQDGMYRKDGTIFKVQRAVNGSGHLYAKTLVVDGPGEGHFEYTPGAISTLSPDDRMSAEEAAEFGRLYGMCIVCGATLTDENSIEAGIGPICRGKV